MNYGSKPVHPFEHAYNGGTISAEGMTLREAFAMAAMPMAWAAESASPTGMNLEPSYRGVAARACLLADALLTELDKQP